VVGIDFEFPALKLLSCKELVEALAKAISSISQ